VVVALVLLAPTLAARADDKTLFIELELRGSPLPAAVTGNGAMIVGNFDGGGGFYWMPTTGVIFSGGRSASAVSADGRTIVGTAVERGVDNAAIWLRGTEWRMLGGVPGGAACFTDLSTGTDTSRDGSVVVGFAWLGCGLVHAFRWEESTGMVDLGSTVAGESSQAHAVSGDGRVIAGSQEANSFDVGVRWVDGRQERIPGPEVVVGTAYDANNDGSIVVGRQCRPLANDQTAWIWKAGEGTSCLPMPRIRPSDLYLGYARATSDDGRVVGGAQRISAADSAAVIWIDGSPSYLEDYLRANGVPDAFRLWINTGEITDVSPDGRILVGYGQATGGLRGYLVILGEAE
jgi:probable HAF family extracellular repeat protein